MRLSEQLDPLAENRLEVFARVALADVDLLCVPAKNVGCDWR
jgi:hypothetical protein